MKSEELKGLYARGFIPGANEDEYTFSLRVAKHAAAHDSYVVDHFGFLIDWVPVAVGKTSFFEAGYTTFDQGVSVTLNKRLPWYINLGELLSHELVHAFRAGFYVSKYEEVLAYMTSKSVYRKILGPAFSTQSLVYGLVAAFGMSLFFLVNEWISPLMFATFTLLPLLLESVRTYRKIRVIERARAFYKKQYEKYTDTLLLHLSDGEIENPHVQTEGIRWKQINTVYRKK